MPGSRWTSFVAGDGDGDGDRRHRTLHEEGNPSHRLRVEHDRDTLLVKLSDEDGHGWTVIAVERSTRRFAVAQAPRQLDATRDAYESLYGGDRPS